MEARDRRRQPRFEVLNQLDVHLVGPGTAVAIRDIGVGGFSIETSFPFVPGEVHQFRFTVPGPWSVVLPVRVVHARRTKKAQHVTGFAFVATPDRERVVAELMDCVAAVLAPRRGA